MTVALSGNFLVNARSLTFTDTASVTWAFNTQTNSLTATSSGGGGGSSANPSATIGLTAVNGSAGTFMTSDSAPPLSQAITPTWTNLHTFTGGVTITSGGTLTIDLYTLSLTANASLGGTNTGDQVIPTGANPSGTIGLTANNGSAATFMRSDGTPALGVAISPTWTGNHTFSPASGVPIIANMATGSTEGLLINPYASGQIGLRILDPGTNATDFRIETTNTLVAILATGTTTDLQLQSSRGTVMTLGAVGTVTIPAPASGNIALSVTGVASSYTAGIYGSSSSGDSYGLVVQAGTTSADVCALLENQAHNAVFLQINGDGSGTLGISATSGLQWTSTGAMTSNIGTTLTTAVTIGTTSAKTVGFYGTSPAAQTASNSSMVTSNVSSVLSTVATASSTALTTAVNATINAHGSAIIQNGKMLQQVINVLQAIGIYATH